MIAYHVRNLFRLLMEYERLAQGEHDALFPVRLQKIEAEITLAQAELDKALADTIQSYHVSYKGG